ncbi:hypothetical protein [Mesorhizobium sp.]|uniref:hypothetical protein n=1 Tax=Mesorhizobium sp. TaxID=1871066 RepID=UPI00257C8CDC|nr:hypothetical protein [Mesorhizobium sp.]
MSKKERVFLVTVIIEAALAGLWWCLASYGMANPDHVTADFQQVVGQTMGTAMGALLGIGVMCFSSPPATTAKPSKTRCVIRATCVHLDAQSTL